MIGFDIFFPAGRDRIRFESLDVKMSRDSILDQLFQTAKEMAGEVRKLGVPVLPDHDGHTVMMVGRIYHDGREEKWAFTQAGELCLMTWPDSWARYL
jgi:hypothetical protein